jgi:uncharacterized protein with ATP-grasp and redox domains
MRTFLECIPCFIRQTVDAVKMITDDPTVHEQVVREVLREAAVMDLAKTPPHMAQRIHRVIRQITGINDPYAEIKRHSNAFAAGMYPELKSVVDRSDRPFETAVRLAIAGNIIDFGVQSAQLQLDESLVHDSIEDALNSPIDEAAISDFRNEIDSAERMLYIADNAGEIVFDRILIEQMPTEKVTFVVKGRPILNDATMEDAASTGITDLVEVMDNGSDAPGTILESCSREFRTRFDSADLVMAKGQGNYETLSDVHKKTFFLLKVKCPVVARHVGVHMGSIVITRNNQSVLE